MCSLLYLYHLLIIDIFHLPYQKNKICKTLVLFPDILNALEDAFLHFSLLIFIWYQWSPWGSWFFAFDEMFLFGIINFVDFFQVNFIGTKLLQCRGNLMKNVVVLFISFCGTATPTRWPMFRTIFSCNISYWIALILIALYTENHQALFLLTILDHKVIYSKLYEICFLVSLILGRPISFSYYYQPQLLILYCIWLQCSTITWAGHTLCHNENDLIAQVHIKLWGHDSPFEMFGI